MIATPKRRPLALVAAAIAFWVALPAHAADKPTTSPFLIDYETIKARVDTVVLPTMWVADGLGDRDTVRALFTPLVRKALVDAGFAVVPEEISDGLFNDIARRAGGVYNVLTGRIIHDKAQAAREHWIRELAERHGVDAVVDTALIITSAPFGADNKVRACGRTMSMRPEGESGFTKFLEDVVLGQTHGAAHVVCLGLNMEDLAGVSMYRHLGGIEPMVKIDDAKMSDKSTEDFFKSEKNNHAGVEVAVKPLEVGHVWHETNSQEKPREQGSSRPGGKR